MELLKEIRIEARKAKCILDSESFFHLNVLGLDDFLGKKMFVKVTDVVFPKILKSLSFSLYIGPKRSELLTDSDVKTVSLTYSSIEQLCMRLNYECKRLLIVNNCKNTSSQHDKHVCDGLKLPDVFSYKCDLVTITLPSTLILVITSALAFALGFEKLVFESFSESEKLNRSKSELLQIKNKPVKFDGGLFVSDSLQFLKDEERFCHFSFPNLLKPSIFFGIPQNVLFSYDVSRQTVNEQFNVKAIKLCSNMGFYILNDNLEPFHFGQSLSEIRLSFTLQLLSPL